MLKFLLIDDNKETLMLLEKILSDHGQCITASNGPDALEIFEAAHQQKAPFHLIFLDIVMPEMDGHEVLKAIRRLEKAKYAAAESVKIAMLTALGDGKNRFDSYEEGCEYYLVKPIIRAEILEIIRKTEEWFDIYTL